MASQVGNVLAAVQARVAGPKYSFGRKYVAKHEAGQRVVWVPGVDRFEPAKNVRAPGAVYTRAAQVEAFVFADDYDATCALLSALVLALHDESRGALEIEQAEWFNPAWLDSMDGCRLVFRLACPVMRTAPSTAHVTAATFDTSGSAAGDGALDAGES